MDREIRDHEDTRKFKSLSIKKNKQHNCAQLSRKLFSNRHKLLEYPEDVMGKEAQIATRGADISSLFKKDLFFKATHHYVQIVFVLRALNDHFSDHLLLINNNSKGNSSTDYCSKARESYYLKNLLVGYNERAKKSAMQLLFLFFALPDVNFRLIFANSMLLNQMRRRCLYVYI